MNLTRAAITRPVFIYMLVLGALLMGFISFRGMRVEDNPEVNFGVVQVLSIYPGAGPDEVNTLVTRKIEEAVSGVNGIREVTSQSLEGMSSVTVEFEIGTNMDVALNDLRSKVDSFVSKLPTAVEKPTINKFDSASFPVLYLVLKSDVLTNKELRDLADDKLKDRFARIPGVSSVGVSGGDVREIQVRVRKDKLLSYGVGIDDLQRAIATVLQRAQRQSRRRAFGVQRSPSRRVQNGRRDSQHGPPG
jgi:HAE1 family hydrophobic/amphiphilic exporter-1